jgi:lipopolysaccharide biosynthesis regulator YciM
LTDYSLFRYIQLIPKRVLINIYQYQFNEWDKGNNDAIEWLKKDPKRQIIGLPHSEVEKARQLEKPHYDEWLSVAKKGFDGEKLLDKVRSLARKYAD